MKVISTKKVELTSEDFKSALANSVYDVVQRDTVCTIVRKKTTAANSPMEQIKAKGTISYELVAGKKKDFYIAIFTLDVPIEGLNGLTRIVSDKHPIVDGKKPQPPSKSIEFGLFWAVPTIKSDATKEEREQKEKGIVFWSEVE